MYRASPEIPTPPDRRESRGSDLLEVGVLERQALAADTGEVHCRDDVGAFALEADEQPLAPTGVAQLGAEAKRKVIGGLGGNRSRVARSWPGALGHASVQQPELGFGDLEEKAGGVRHAVAEHAAMLGP